jgi:hypothetical protein
MKISKGTVPVDELIADVQNAITDANVSGRAPTDLRVRSAQLTLNVVASGGGGGKVDFRVPVIGMKLSFGGKVTRTDTHTIDVTLVPPPPDEYEVRGGPVAQVLVEAIGTIRRIMREAGSGPQRLILDTSSVELSFAVTDEGTISLGFEGELRDEVTHTIRLELGPAQ